MRTAVVSCSVTHVKIHRIRSGEWLIGFMLFRLQGGGIRMALYFLAAMVDSPPAALRAIAACPWMLPCR